MLLVLAAAAGLGGVLGGGGAGGPSREPGRREATVTRVVDGDSVILSTLGRSRLIGVDTPEIDRRRECFGAQASLFAKRMLSGRRVRYATGVERRDRYGRALVYLWLRDGRFFNELLVERGYARPLAIAPNVRYAELLRSRARQARAAGLGLWSASACG